MLWIKPITSSRTRKPKTPPMPLFIQMRGHPRAVRTMEYADHCDEVWISELPSPYPSFEDWRRDADSYVELTVN